MFHVRVLRAPVTSIEGCSAWQGRILTWSIDGPTGWLDGKLQAYHKSFDGFRGAVVFMAAAGCWEQTLVVACSDGIICCLDLTGGDRCVEFNAEALIHTGDETGAPLVPGCHFAGAQLYIE